MSYYTTVKVVNKTGEAVQAEVTCAGSSRGFTDKNTGEVSFELRTKDSYSVSAKRMGESAAGTVYSGQKIVLRLS